MSLSQFYRAFLAVLSPVLEGRSGRHGGRSCLGLGLVVPGLCRDADAGGRGAGPDRAAPDRGVAAGGRGGGGGAVRAGHGGRVQIKLAMALIGVGCAPVLMASYFIFARSFRPPSSARWPG